MTHARLPMLPMQTRSAEAVMGLMRMGMPYLFWLKTPDRPWSDMHPPCGRTPACYVFRA